MQPFVELGVVAMDALLEKHWHRVPDKVVRGDTYRPKFIKRRRSRRMRNRQNRGTREVDEVEIEETQSDGGGRDIRRYERDEIEVDDRDRDRDRRNRRRDSRRDDYYYSDEDRTDLRDRRDRRSRDYRRDNDGFDDRRDRRRRDDFDFDDRRDRDRRRDDFDIDDRRERRRDDFDTDDRRDRRRDDFDIDDRRDRRRDDLDIDDRRDRRRKEDFDLEDRRDRRFDDGRLDTRDVRDVRTAQYGDRDNYSVDSREIREPLAPRERYDGRSRIRSKSLGEDAAAAAVTYEALKAREREDDRISQAGRDVPRETVEDVVEEEIVEVPMPPVAKADTVITAQERRNARTDRAVRSESINDAQSVRSDRRSQSSAPGRRDVRSASIDPMPSLPPPPIQAMENFKSHANRQLTLANQKSRAQTFPLPDPEQPNGQELVLPSRPRLVSRRSQSVDAYERPNRDRRRDRDRERDRRGRDSRRNSVFSGSEAGLGAGTLGAVAGGFLAQQAQHARAKSRIRSGEVDVKEEDNLLLTALGAAVGGLGANALVGRSESQKRRDREREREKAGRRQRKTYRDKDGKEVREFVVDRRGGKDEWTVDRRVVYLD